MKKFTPYLLMAALILAVAISGCGGGNNSPSGNNQPGEGNNPPGGGDNATIYIAGWQENMDSPSTAGDYAWYWTKGSSIPTDLGSGCATSICVSGDTIYISGYKSASGAACYWTNKDTTPTILAPGGESGISGQAVSNCESGGNIYTAGFDGMNGGHALYWKNSDSTPVFTGPDKSMANSIFASENNIYLGGYIIDSGHLTACYWTNDITSTSGGTLTTLGPVNSEVKSIGVSGGLIYCAGSNDGKACYWTHDGDTTHKPTYQELGGPDTVVNSICVSGGSIYYAGKNGVRACYWVNDSSNLTYADNIYTHYVVPHRLVMSVI